MNFFGVVGRGDSDGPIKTINTKWLSFKYMFNTNPTTYVTY